MRTNRTALLAVALAVLASCADKPPGGEGTVRLNPLSVSASPSLDADADALVDRDTTTGLRVSEPLTVTLRFARVVEVRRIKVFGRDVAFSADDFREATAQPGAWTTAAASSPTPRAEITLRFSPDGPSASLEEVEVWGKGAPAAPREPLRLAEATRSTAAAPFENAAVFAANPPAFTLAPASEQEGGDCRAARLSSQKWARLAKRAFLAYQGTGVQRPVVLSRSLNGHAPSGGFWLGGSSAERTVVDELDPSLLTGEDVVKLCLPAEATGPVSVSDLRLLVELDDGTNLWDRDTLLRLAEAGDGDSRTAATFRAGTLALSLDRPVSLERAEVHLDSPAAHAKARARSLGGWSELQEVALTRGRNELLAPGQAEAFELELAAMARPDIPAASISEAWVVGSGLGRRTELPRIVITYPRLSFRDGLAVGERFGERAFLVGWAEGPAGRASIEVAGAPVGVGDGAFSVALEKPARLEGSWPVVVRARFADGTEVSRTIHFDADASEDLLRDGPAVSGLEGGEERLFGRENQTAWGTVTPEKGGTVTLGTRVGFEAPPGAVAGPVNVGITRKSPEAVPPLEPGMVNVTAPENVGYRFLPPGQKFLKPVRVTLPYDSRLLPDGTSPEEIQTFYFDRLEDRWMPLPRRQLLRATEQVVSETTHFTFMVNAVLVLPEHPGPVSFNPTSLKDLKAADPSAGIELIEPPQGNNQGTARLAFPIRLPRARGAHQPDVRLVYDSGGGNGWLGVGWDLPVSSVQVDTRFGVPRYSGSDLYLLDGQLLVPVGSGACLGGATGSAYAQRVERDFKRIRRCGAGPASYHWEVTDKDGTVFVYGKNSTARLESTYGDGIAEWMLERVVDANGNLTLYEYDVDAKDPKGSGEDWRRLYLRAIHYTLHVSDVFDSPSESAPYTVHFEHENDGQAFTVRPDVQVSGRTGFKVATRFRLGRITVRLNVGPTEQQGIIRSYELGYIREHIRAGGDFGRSLLSVIRSLGAMPASASRQQEFYAHRLDYFRSSSGDRAFGAPETWSLGNGDGRATTESAESTFRMATYVGLAPTLLPIKAASAGVSLASSSGERRTFAQLVDLNGDGLPDRVSDGAVHFNQSAPVVDGQGMLLRNKAFSSAPPEGDPAHGSTLAYSGEVDQRFRSMPITRSGACRSPDRVLTTLVPATSPASSRWSSPELSGSSHLRA